MDRRAEKDTARQLAKANAVNFQGKVEQVLFAESAEALRGVHMVILLNCSFRGKKSNSNYFLNLVESQLSFQL